MILKQHINQVFNHLRTQPLLSGLQVTGTALAIFMIMVYVMIQDIHVESIAPESYRDRYLHVPHMSIIPKDTAQHWSNNGAMSNMTFRKCFKPLQTPEAVACYTHVFAKNVGIANGTEISTNIKYCSEGFWHVFNFTFLNGRPFNEAESESGIRVAVITEDVAKTLFGSEEASGKDIVINKTPFRVVGVAENVSPIATNAFSDVWIPYGIADRGCAWNNPNDAHGVFSTSILAHSTDDFLAIRQECETLRLKFNESWSNDLMLIYRNQPYDQKKSTYSTYSNEEPNMDDILRLRFITIFCLLLVPAINLSSMTQSRFHQRMVEIGVRRAFGSTRSSILSQVFFENLVLTVLSGTLGLLFCLIFAQIGSDFLFRTCLICFNSNTTQLNINITMLMHASTFLYALLFCFILNLMSSLYPAWKASRSNIINALSKN